MAPIWQTDYSPTDVEFYNSQVTDDEYFNSLSLGYVFHPTDASLIVDYLIPKIQNQTLPRNLIKVVNDVYDLNPETLEDEYGANRAEEWLFFAPRNRDCDNEKIRRVDSVIGYWQEIRDDDVIGKDYETVGFRKTFEFYHGNPPSGDKTLWTMHEFRPDDDQLHLGDEAMLDDWVLCKVYHKENRWREDENLDDVMSIDMEHESYPSESDYMNVLSECESGDENVQFDCVKSWYYDFCRKC